MTSQRYDSAVLFVHGIGEQQRGATLEEFGGSLVDSARAWYGAANVTDVPSGLPGTDANPAHRAVLVTRPGHEPLRLLLAESCWAKEVRAPRWGALMGWLAGTVPFLVQRAVDAGMRRSNEKIDVNGRTLVALGFGARRLVQNVFAVSLALFVLGALFAVGLVARFAPVRERLFDARTTGFPRWAYVGAALTLGTIGLLAHLVSPSGVERTALIAASALPTVVLLSLSGRLRAIVVGFIGDSYALLHEDGPQNAIVDRVADDLSWVESAAGSAPVVIVAHSQGAEVARRALAGRATAAPPIAGLVTFGAGIAKLDAVGKLRGQRRRSFGAFALRGLSAACVCLAPILLVTADVVTPPLLATAVALIAAGALALTAARNELQRIVGARLEPAALEIDKRQVAHWTDLHASHDLVSEGDLPVAKCTRGFSRTVVNRRSMLLDHVAYWRNVEGFQATVALEIDRATQRGANPRRPLGLARAERARSRIICAIDGVRLAVAILVPVLWIGVAQNVWAGALIAGLAIGLLVGAAKLLDLLATARTRAWMTAPPPPPAAPPRLVTA